MFAGFFVLSDFLADEFEAGQGDLGSDSEMIGDGTTHFGSDDGFEHDTVIRQLICL